MPHLISYKPRRRTWRERLFTLPWQPFTAVEMVKHVEYVSEPRDAVERAGVAEWTDRIARSRRTPLPSKMTRESTPGLAADPWRLTPPPAWTDTVIEAHTPAPEFKSGGGGDFGGRGATSSWGGSSSDSSSSSSSD